MNSKEIKFNDSIIKHAVSDLSSNTISPMDPPDPYLHQSVEDIPYEKMSDALKELIDEHSIFAQIMEDFESAVNKWYNLSYIFDDEINQKFKTFFTWFDVNTPQHNAKEEKILFPIIQQKLIESRENNRIDKSKTAIDVLEDEHIKISQAASVVFNLLGLGSRIIHKPSRETVFHHTFEQGLRIVGTIRLHMYMEEKIIFPLAMKLLSQDELANINEIFESYN